MRILIWGVVQGVGFRPTAYRVAKRLGYRGYVRNLGGMVEICVDGDPLRFVEELRRELPPPARIEGFRIEEGDCPGVGDFLIIRSGESSGPIPIPPDLAICDDCLREILDPSHPRFMYPFNSCTKCGPRFSITFRVPYDRENTTMSPFPLECGCLEEYSNPSSRRFHHQAISCPGSGPEFFLLDGSGKRVQGDPFRRAAELLDSGAVGVMKSWGGMHVVSTLEVAQRVRELYMRPSKPFAVMFRNLETVEKYAYVSEVEREILESRERPIVLLRRRDRGELEVAAPGLPFVGAYIPYSAAQVVLFQHLAADSLIMTSANLPGRPMVIENEDALKLPADFYLLHNVGIANRVDDSVVKVVSGSTAFLRRSRGYVPRPYPFGADIECVAVGAEQNNAAAISHEGRIYGTQHIGDCDNPEVLEFLHSAIRRLMEMSGMHGAACIAEDLHPRYGSRIIAERLSEELGSEIIEVQHHFAHAASLLMEHGEEEGAVLALDGTGYGLDGGAWGGEVVKVHNGKFERVGSLQEFPLVGGDEAVRRPRRSLIGLFLAAGMEPPFEVEEAIVKAARFAPRSTSMGRFLDALSYFFGVSDIRTYEGEPAMKLETLLLKGVGSVPVEHEVRREGGRKVVLLRPVLEYLIESRDPPEKRAMAAVKAVLNGLLEIALDEGLPVGVSGGVAYDVPIVEHLREVVPDIMLHRHVPPGDAGIAVGQIAYVSLSGLG